MHDSIIKFGNGRPGGIQGEVEMQYTISALENITRGDRFEEFRSESSELRFVTTFAVEADSEYSALDLAWVAGNRQSVPVIWPQDRRSMSVGDVLMVTLPGTYPAHYFAVADMGFEAVTAEQVTEAVQR